MKRWRKPISLLLTLAMVLSMVTVPVHADDGVVALSDPGFETDLWNGSPWSISFPDGDGWGTKQVQWLKYADDSYMDIPNGGENSYVKVYMADGGKLQITQTLTNVPAGTYKVTAMSMGDGGETVAVVMGDQIGETVQTNAGYNNWATSSGTFTVEESGSMAVGVQVTCTTGGWASIDCLTLTKVDTGSGDSDDSDDQNAPELTLDNGNFETGGSTGWTLSGYSTVKADSYASNNATSALDLWLNDNEAASGAASYSVALTAGTYHFTFDLSGAAMDSGLSYAITAGETELAKGGSTYTTGGWDVWQTETTKSFTLTEETTVTFTLSGTQPAGYWGSLDNLKLYGTGALAEVAPDPVDADIYVPYIKGTDGDFMRGMDVSSLLSVLNSGATFKDYDGNTLDGQGFMNLLAQTGTNWVRIRVWNDPFDGSGNGYGGGNCDIEAAKVMGKWATDAGLKVLIDFHYSDFWADPGKQQAPKAWADYTVDEKADAIYAYTKDSLEALKAAGVNVGMVQIGNETTNSMCGVSDWEDRCTLFSAGAKAVRDLDSDILVAIHFTNPERSGNYANFAQKLDTYGVDYDVFASSYYPYWHGTLDNLTSVLKQVADTYGKQVIVAETSWAYTLDDGDGHDNTVRKNNNDAATYPFSVQGQATEIAAVAQAVKNVGDAGIGIFYWEPAWIPVGTPDELEQNKVLWEQYGSGWASSYAGEYDPNDAGVWYGGSAWDNQALFAFDGTPLESLKTYLYMQTGTAGFDIVITAVEEPALNYTVGDTLVLPETLTVSFNVGADEEKAVTWNADDVAAVDMSTPGTYVVNGTIEGDVAARCTITVKPVNLLVNPGMEDSDMSMYAISQAYARRKTDDPHSGSYSMHFYNSGVVSFTAEQTVTLQPGHYEFSLFGQGGSLGEDAATYAYVKLGEETLTADFALTGWAIWVNPTVSFSLREETQVTVGVSVTASQNGAWGTFDDWYLCKISDHSYDTDGKCVDCEAQAVAKVGDDYYLTFAEAVSAAVSGDTVTLLSDVTIGADETVTFAEGVTLDANGHDITCNGAVKIGTYNGIIFQNQLYYYGGDETNGELALYGTAFNGPTYYTAGDGYAIYDGIGTLHLHNVTIDRGDQDNSEDKQCIGAQDDLTIHFSGTNTIIGGNSDSGTWAVNCYGSLTLIGSEDSVLNVVSGNTPSGDGYGIHCDRLTVIGGTVNVSGKASATGIAATGYDPNPEDPEAGDEPVPGDVTVTDGAVLNVTCANGITAAGTISTASGGVINAVVMMPTTFDNTIEIDYTVVGDAVLAADFDASFYKDFYEEYGITVAITFTVPTGTSLTVSQGVTVDLDGLSCEDIDLSGTIVNNGTLLLPEHSPAEDDGDCTTEVKCTVCGTVTTEAKTAHTPAEDDGNCTVCGVELVAAVTINGVTTGYTTFADAIGAVAECTATDMAEVKLLENVELSSSQSITGGVFTLNLNDKKISITTDYNALDVYGEGTHVTIHGGTITGGENTYCVSVKDGATVTINGGTIGGEEGHGIEVFGGTLNITNGQILAEFDIYYAVTATNATVNISGGTVSSGQCGVIATNSKVTISGGTFSGINNAGVFVEGADCTIQISGGTISGPIGLRAFSGAEVTITRGSFNGSLALYAFESSVEVSGGSFSGSADEQDIYLDNSTLTLTVADGKTEGATFPGGFSCNEPLNSILGEGAAYWQGDKMIFIDEAQYSITDGDVTIKKACDHNMQQTSEREAPSCGADGKEAVFTCANGCGKTEGGEPIPATGAHSYTVEVPGTKVPATCMATGTVTMKCENCDETEDQTLEIDKHNHTKKNTTVKDAADATCGENGYTGDTYCECGEKIADGETIDKLTTHTPAKDDGDCTTEVKCTVCGTVTTEAKDAHTGGEATCSDKAVCSDCGKEYGNLDPENHAGGTEIRNAAAATEDAEGYTGDTHCLGCGEKLENGKVIPKLESEKPEETEPEETEPEETEPEETEPEETEPEETEPEATEPEATEPEETEPEETEPEATEPEATEPETTEPGESKPDGSSPETGDRSAMMLLTAVLLISVLAMAVLVIGNKKYAYSAKYVRK